MTETPDEANDVGPDQKYIAYGSTAFSRFLLSRTAEKNADFFVPYLRPGMKLLDCGCGPGSITVGLAKRVAPGQTIGIDINPGEIEFALRQFADQVSPHIQFETASIYDLPFDDHTFDAVFSHAVLEHLSDPLKALQEIDRVLKPGGMVGIRNPDKDGQLLAPVDPLLWQFWEVSIKAIEANGGNMRFGKEQRMFLRQAGFVNIETSASYDCHGPEIAEVFIEVLEEGAVSQQLMQLGQASRSDLAKMAQAWQDWADNPDRLFADAFCESVGWKSKSR